MTLMTSQISAWGSSETKIFHTPITSSPLRIMACDQGAGRDDFSPPPSPPPIFYSPPPLHPTNHERAGLFGGKCLLLFSSLLFHTSFGTTSIFPPPHPLAEWGKEPLIHPSVLLRSSPTHFDQGFAKHCTVMHFGELGFQKYNDFAFVANVMFCVKKSSQRDIKSWSCG